MGEDADDHEVYPEESDTDHEWHFRYNRRLSCFSHAVSSLGFAPDGQYLVSGTGSGDVKVWDTGCWAEAGKLRGCRREEPRSLVISPAQRWLVAAYPSVLHIFNFTPPWRLECSLPAILDPMTKEQSEWKCIAFSPMAEVDHPRGHAGQDNNLAAFSSSSLCVLDYSGGWGEDAPRRTRSLMQSSKPSILVYTACGTWMICGFMDGQLQIWNSASLTMVRTLSAHTDAVNGLVASPYVAPYPPRIVSCGVDQTLRVWHSQGWILEQHVHDMHCDRAGIRSCNFSVTGNWLMSVANELCIWRVNITLRGRLILTLHQRLVALCGAEGLRTAAFSNSDAIAVGSRDGVLGLWTKYPGMPPDPAEEGSPPTPPASAGSIARSETWGESRCARPMQRVTSSGIKPLPRQLSRGEWFQQAQLRPVPSSRSYVGNSPAASASGKLVCNSPSGNNPGKGFPNPAPGFTRTATMPDLARVQDLSRSRMAGREQMFATIPFDRSSKVREMTLVTRQQRPSSSSSELMGDNTSPVRQSMQRACRNMVTRISLDPKVIIEHANFSATA